MRHSRREEAFRERNFFGTFCVFSLTLMYTYVAKTLVFKYLWHIRSIFVHKLLDVTGAHSMMIIVRSKATGSFCWFLWILQFSRLDPRNSFSFLTELWQFPFQRKYLDPFFDPFPLDQSLVPNILLIYRVLKGTFKDKEVYKILMLTACVFWWSFWWSS